MPEEYDKTNTQGFAVSTPVEPNWLFCLLEKRCFVGPLDMNAFQEQSRVLLRDDRIKPSQRRGNL